MPHRIDRLERELEEIRNQLNILIEHARLAGGELEALDIRGSTDPQEAQKIIAKHIRGAGSQLKSIPPVGKQN